MGISLPESVDSSLFYNLLKLTLALNPETTLEKMSESRQEAVCLFARMLSQNLMKQGVSEDTLTGLILRSFCLGHEWALRHWGLWNTDNNFYPDTR